MRSLLISLFVVALLAIQCSAQYQGGSIYTYYMNQVTTFYNAKDYKSIYNLFSPALKSQVTQAQFVAGLTVIQNQAGKMMNSTYLLPSSSNPECQIFINPYYNDLILGSSQICIDSSYEISNLSLSINPNSFFKFLSENPSQVGLSLILNDSILTEWNPNQNFSIMSTYKMSVVLEYARQWSLGLISPNQTFTLNQINTYYLEGIDSGHADWLQLMGKTGNIVNNSIQLYQIAWGMVYYSSNCNTEFLQTLLGLQNISNTLQLYNISMNANIYCASASLALINDLNLPYNYWIDSLRGLTHNDLVTRANYYHDQLLKNSTLRLNNAQWFLNATVLDIQASIFAESSPSAWNRINQLINKKIFFDAKMQNAIEYVMFPTLTSYGGQLDFYRSHYRSGGVKGGSSNYPEMTNAVLAITFFEQDKWNNVFSLFWVVNGITHEQFTYRYLDMNNFNNALQFNAQFRNEFVTQVNKLKNSLLSTSF